ncbi:MAG: ArdC family protein [Dehalococcoidia bacterium]
MAAEIAALSDAERAAIVARLGRCVTVEGHALSVRNACLVWMQRPDASVVAGFRQWLAAGRSVRKGEHGIGIWAPTGGRDGDEGDEGPRFVFVTVFDVAQTEAVAS